MENPLYDQETLESLDPRIGIICCTNAPRNNNGINLAIIRWIILLHHVIDVQIDPGLFWPRLQKLFPTTFVRLVLLLSSSLSHNKPTDENNDGTRDPYGGFDPHWRSATLITTPDGGIVAFIFRVVFS